MHKDLGAGEYPMFYFVLASRLVYLMNMWYLQFCFRYMCRCTKQLQSHDKVHVVYTFAQTVA